MNAVGFNHIVTVGNIIESYFEGDYYSWRQGMKWDFWYFIGK